MTYTMNFHYKLNANTRTPKFSKILFFGNFDSEEKLVADRRAERARIYRTLPPTANGSTK